MSNLIAYHGRADIKKKYLGRVRAHRLADNLKQGVTWENGKGCAIGCTLEAYRHERYEAELGVPQPLAQLEDSIFEGLPKSEAQKWPEAFLRAIKPGADLSLVWAKFAVWLLLDKKAGVLRYANSDAAKKAITGVADCYKRVIKGGKVSKKEWGRVCDAAANSDIAAYYYAVDAAYYCARAAHYSAANSADAHYSAANSASAAHYSAANAAYYSADAAAADGYAARKLYWKRCATKLLALLRAAPLTKKTKPKKGRK